MKVTHRRMTSEAVVLGVEYHGGGLRRDGLLDLLDGLEGVEVLTLAHVLLILVVVVRVATAAGLPDSEEAELLVHRSVGRRLRGPAGGQVVDVAVRSAVLIWFCGKRSKSKYVRFPIALRKKNCREMTQRHATLQFHS